MDTSKGFDRDGVLVRYKPYSKKPKDKSVLPEELKRRQSAFNKVLVGLRRQGEPAFDPMRQQCRYRMALGGKTLRCAVGMLIPRSQYIAEIEDTAIANLAHPGSAVPFPESIKGLNIEFLTDLQTVHDLWGSTGDAALGRRCWESSMRDIAAANGLVYVTPEGAKELPPEQENDDE